MKIQRKEKIAEEVPLLHYIIDCHFPDTKFIYSVFQILSESAANFGVTDAHDQTLLHKCCKLGAVELILLLLQMEEIDIMALDVDKNTPFDLFEGDFDELYNKAKTQAARKIIIPKLEDYKNNKEAPKNSKEKKKKQKKIA